MSARIVGHSCVTLCNPMDCSPLGSSVHGILQARILEWVAICSSGDLPHPGFEPVSPVAPALAGEFFTIEPPGKPLFAPSEGKDDYHQCQGHQLRKLVLHV